MSPNPTSLSALRKSKGLTQEELGNAISQRLNIPIGATYAQKKIARFESGATSPSPDERIALAAELGVDVQYLETLLSDAPFEGVTVIHDFAPKDPGGRCLIPSCMLSRPRPQGLDDTLRAVIEMVEKKNVSLAIFVPYPRIVNLPESSDHTDLLAGYYAHVRNAVSDANLLFKNSLNSDAAKQKVALYFLKADANVLIPPVLRQFNMKVEVAPGGLVTKSLLNMWTPGTNADVAHPVKATGLYTLEVQVELWSAFFGGIMSHWVEFNEFRDSDAYWTRIR